MTSTTPLIGSIVFQEDLNLLRRSIGIEQARIDRLERELEAHKDFVKAYLNTHGLEDRLSDRANQLLKHDMCRRESLHK